MSHVVTIATEIRDLAALRAACRRLALAEPLLETTRLFSGEATGHCVRLPDWRYPVVCDLRRGQVRYDNYNGRWGDQRELNRLLQGYAVEKTRLEAHRNGHGVTESQLADGAIKLTINVGGAV